MATHRTLSATLIATVTIAGFAGPPLSAADKIPSIAAVRLVHVMIANPVVRQRVELAIHGASQRLEGLECQRLFTEFQDGAGQPLQARLDAIHLTGAAFLTWIRFTEGEGLPLCLGTSQVAAFTQPGSRVVQVCGGVFARQSAAHSKAGEVLIIHELLHTLGLEENPPSSAEISRRVVERCGGQPVQRKPIWRACWGLALGARGGIASGSQSRHAAVGSSLHRGESGASSLHHLGDGPPQSHDVEGL